MTSPLEQPIQDCLAASPKRLYLSDIQVYLRKQGTTASKDVIEAVLNELVNRGRVIRSPPGWRLAGTVRSTTTVAPPTPSLNAIGTMTQVTIPTSARPQTNQKNPAVSHVRVSGDGDAEPVTTTVRGGRWQRFRRLLAYYQDCIIMEDAPEIRGFLQSIHEQWLPIVGRVPWETLSQGQGGFTMQLRSDQGVFQANRARRGEDMSLYIGYPVKVFKMKQRPDEAFAVPIFVQPVDADWQSHVIRLTPEGQPTVNTAWASYAFKEKGEREAFYTMVGLGAPGDNEKAVSQSSPTLDALASRMGSWFGDAAKTPIAPHQLDNDESYQEVETGIYNRAVLMLGPRLKFTKSLLRELREIANWSDQDIEKSALRFLFPCDENDTGAAWPWKAHPPGLTPDRIAMTNVLFGAQRVAVEHASCRPVTVVTGPPGTGKSEVVRAVLMNQLIRERPTVMASRNHSAIEAVVPRLNDLGDGEPVIIRASSPDIRTRNGWKEQLRTLLSRPNPNQSSKAEAHVETVIRHADRLRNAAERFRKQSALGQTYTEASLRHANAEARIPVDMASWREHVQAWNDEQSRTLEQLRSLCSQQESGQAWWNRFINLLFGRKSQSRQDQIAALEAKLPNITTLAGIQDRLGFWQHLREVATSSERLRDIERLLENLPPTEPDEEIRTSIDQLRQHVLELVKLMAGGSAGVSLDQIARQRLRNLWAGTENFNGKRFNDELRREFPLILRAFPLWSVTNLSVKSAVPLIPGIFDLVVIDEASQCDIPSVVPLLARSRRAMIVGDPMQLTHITKMASEQEQLLLARHDLAEFDLQRFSYRINSAYGLAEAAPVVEQPILLDVHLRCHAEIADFAGATFYRGGLQVGTDHARLRAPQGQRAGIQWTDVVGPIESAQTSIIAPAEIETCARLLADLQKSGYEGTVGVVTPFRPQATRINDAVERVVKQEVLARWDFLASTAHGFQGDERDLMIYSLCCGDGMNPSTAGWLSGPEGRCLMNVAITRARAVLHVIGNQAWAEASGIPHIASLARSCRVRAERTVQPAYESPWEERFDKALRAAGISTVLQHPVAHRRLDLAVLSPIKIDLEVDGESTHRSASGRRKDDDYWRDIQITALGWTVLRFWVYELREDMPKCVERVKLAIHGNKK